MSLTSGAGGAGVLMLPAFLVRVALRVCSWSFPPALLAFAALRACFCPFPPALLVFAALRACFFPFPPASLALVALRACGWAGADEVGVRSPASGRRGLLLVR